MKKIILILLFNLFLANICYANSYTNVDIIGTINLDSTPTNIELTFEYGKNFDLMIPATPLLLSKIVAATPSDDPYYASSNTNRKYHVALNIINKNETISSDNINILAVYPLSLEEIDKENNKPSVTSTIINVFPYLPLILIIAFIIKLIVVRLFFSH